MAPQVAHVTPEVLRWARERLGLSLEVLSQGVNRQKSELAEWEAGRSLPTMRQAEKLANKLRIPFGYLFLSHPPEESLPLPDFRMPRAAKQAEMSPDLRDVIDDAILKQEWYKSYLIAAGAPRCSLSGKFDKDGDPKEVGRYLRQQFQLDESPESSTATSDYLLALTRHAEDLGIIVLRNSLVGNNVYRKLSPREFQGFAINDALAPLMFINTADYQAAQIFTFAHELAHIAMGESGVFRFLLDEKIPHPDDELEQVCNQVAAEFLLPAGQFRQHWDPESPAKENILRFRRTHHVSSLVTLRRAYDLVSFPGSATVSITGPSRESSSGFENWKSVDGGTLTRKELTSTMCCRPATAER